MQKFKTIKSIPAYLPIVNIDTDMIIPKQFLKTIKKSGLGKNLFHELRYDLQGNIKNNFVLNWDSSSGTDYQIQSSTDLTNWVNVGSSIVGTGETMTWANHVTNSQAFYRVVEE